MLEIHFKHKRFSSAKSIAAHSPEPLATQTRCIIIARRHVQMCNCSRMHPVTVISGRVPTHLDWLPASCSLGSRIARILPPRMGLAKGWCRVFVWRAGGRCDLARASFTFYNESRRCLQLLTAEWHAGRIRRRWNVIYGGRDGWICWMTV